MASIFQDAVAAALAKQPWYVRRKDSITAAAGTVLQAMNLLVLVAGDHNEWVNLVVAVVIGLAQIVIHAKTKGAITPTMVERLEEAGQDAHLDRPSVTTPPVVDVGVLPTYDGPTTAQG